MKLRHILASAAIVLAAFAPLASAQSLDDPIGKAVMDSYQSMLNENPRDYAVYFRRANVYYNHDMYAKALEDVNAALEYAPAKEKDLRCQSFALRASIYERMEMLPEALANVEEAAKLSPDNYTLLYQKANLEFATGHYDAAKADYKKLQALNSRSQEALFGLARVAAVENNAAQANKYADDAVALTPTSAESYLHRAALRRMMDNNAGAVDDYLTAMRFAKSDNFGKTLQALVELSSKDYNAVINGLSSAISASPRQGSLYYIRAAIAQNNGRYPSAVADYEYILQNNLLDLPSIYRSLAECYYALMRYEEALENVDNAIGSSADNAAAYVVKSDIKRALGAYSQAITAANRTLTKNPDYAPALLAKAIAEVDSELLTEGTVDAGRAVLAAPEDAYFAMVRAWILNDFTGETALATDYYSQIATLTGYAPTDVRSFRGFALLYAGNKADADAWMQGVLAAAAPSDGETDYYGACYYAAAGDNDKAFECMERSLKKGYANRFNWVANTDARINVAPLREDARFEPLLARYSHIFNSSK